MREKDHVELASVRVPHGMLMGQSSSLKIRVLGSQPGPIMQSALDAKKSTNRQRM
jgi:hypothetical protein